MLANVNWLTDLSRCFQVLDKVWRGPSSVIYFDYTGVAFGRSFVCPLCEVLIGKGDAKWHSSCQCARQFCLFFIFHGFDILLSPCWFFCMIFLKKKWEKIDDFGVCCDHSSIGHPFDSLLKKNLNDKTWAIVCAWWTDSTHLHLVIVRYLPGSDRNMMVWTKWHEESIPSVVGTWCWFAVNN